MKLRCKKNSFKVLSESHELFGKAIEETKLIENLTVGKIYEVLTYPENEIDNPYLIFYNDQKEWEYLCPANFKGAIDICNCEETDDDDCECEYGDADLLYLLNFFEPVE